MARYYDSQRDPVDNTIIDTFFWRSVSSTESTSYTTFSDITIPASPNFPNSTATRYMFQLPGEPDYTNILASVSTFVVKNVNSSVVLTRVDYNASLTANTYKIFPPSAASPHRIEVHVGVGSGVSGDVIAYHGRFISSVINSTDINSITENYFLSSGVKTNIKTDKLIIEMGGINMSTTTYLGGANQTRIGIDSSYKDVIYNMEILLIRDGSVHFEKYEIFTAQSTVFANMGYSTGTTYISLGYSTGLKYSATAGNYISTTHNRGYLICDIFSTFGVTL